MKKLYIFIFILINLSLAAQNEVQYTHFLFNKLAYNAAYAGAAQTPIITAIYRNQWLNLDGAPTTATANFHTPLANNRVGLGLNISADRVGMVRTNSIEANYAYRFNLNGGRLSLGLNGRIEQGQVNWLEAAPLDIGDNRIPSIEAARISSNFGFGMYYEKSNFYLGLSIPQLLRPSIYNDLRDANTNNFHRTFYLMTGGLFNMNDNIKLQPGLLVSHNPVVPFELDLNTNIIFLDALWVGANYRLGDSFSAIIQYQFTPQLRLGTAFDFTMTELNSYSNGTIEMMLSYQFIKPIPDEAKQISNLRYF